MRQVFLTLGVLAGVGLVAAAATIGFGLFNVSARIAHFKPVYWALHTTFEQNVRLRAPVREAVPDTINDPDMIRLGAAHYDTACRFCHGAPGEVQNATVNSMNPRPPHITDATRRWDPRHLHWIINNGVKMSGMPHWPTQTRDDDVWPVVAFLNAVPVMTGADYEQQIPRAADAPPGLSYCATCHGLDGRAYGNPYIPRLDIQTDAYLSAAVAAYRDGQRESGIMHQAARVLDDDAISDVITHYSSLPAVRVTSPDTLELTHPGKALAEVAAPNLPSCRACHGPWPSPRNPSFPNLAGQSAPYIETQLKLWRDGVRTSGSAQAELMQDAARNLDDADITALAAYYAGLSAPR